MFQRRDLMAVLLLVALVLAVFWKATTGGIFFFGDIFQLHYPLRSAYARELLRLSLPLWTPDVLAGYPLLAEGQVGALYPPNLILHTLLPVPIALNIFILGHFLLAAVGAYAFARQLGVKRQGAFCAGMVYALSGFLVAHLNHVNIVACAAWLPWLFLLTDRLMVADVPAHRIRNAVWLAVVMGLELLAGHAQIALLTSLAVAAYAIYLAWSLKPRVGVVALVAVSLLLGVALAAAQLLPSYELTEQSARAGGLDSAFFTSFSLHPLYLVSLLLPFLRGNPYPTTSVELVAYVGLLPLVLAVFAPFAPARRKDAQVRFARPARFLGAMGIVAILLALGRWNPAYMVLLRLPLFNLFRVPARYLYLFAFPAAVLSGMGLDAFSGRRQENDSRAETPLGWWAIAAVAVAALTAVALVPSVDELLAVWRWLPVALAVLGLLWLAWVRWGTASYGTRATVALMLVVVDLVAFNAVYNRTYNQTMPLQEFAAAPRSLSFFRSQPGIDRLYTSQEIVPVLPVMRESEYPNLSLIHGLPAANGDFPLVPARYARYLEQMTPRMLDLLGVRYFVIPQVLPVDEASELYDLEDPYALSPVGRVVTTPPTRVMAVEVESYLSHSVDWPDGQEVAEIRLRRTDGEREVITLRAGWHTSEWAYDRTDVELAVRHAQAPVVRSWPARSGFPPEDHRGYVYRAQFRLPSALTIKAVEVRPLVPPAYVRIERMWLVDEAGTRRLLSQLAGMGDHTLAYRSEDAAIYINHDALPRATVVHAARVVPDDAQAMDILREASFDPRSEVLLASGEAIAGEPSAAPGDQAEVLVYDGRRVAIAVHAETEGYLLLTDAWYPGWRASVDGQAMPILRADLIFRAVRVPAGDHEVEFTYDPQSFRVGLGVSSIALLLVAGLALWGRSMDARSS